MLKNLIIMVVMAASPHMLSNTLNMLQASRRSTLTLMKQKMALVDMILIKFLHLFYMALLILPHMMKSN